MDRSGLGYKVLVPGYHSLIREVQGIEADESSIETKFKKNSEFGELSIPNILLRGGSCISWRRFWKVRISQQRIRNSQGVHIPDLFSIGCRSSTYGLNGKMQKVESRRYLDCE